MLLESFKLLILGMTTVIVFLSLMSIIIQIVAQLTKKHTNRELTRTQEELASQKKNSIPTSSKAPIAVFAAAIAAYENN